MAFYEVAPVRQTLRRMFSAMVAERAKKRRKLVLTPVGVEKVRDRNELFAAIVTAIEFFLSTSAKRRLAWEVLSVG
jgi:hypothetical protein